MGVGVGVLVHHVSDGAGDGGSDAGRLEAVR